MMQRHALVVGGTGMLRGGVLGLAAEGYSVSVVARRRQRLETLREEAEALHGFVNPIAVDYTHSDEFAQQLEYAIAALGPIDLSVCWIRSAAMQASLIAAEATSRESDSSRYFDVLGSTWANSLDPLPLRRALFQRFERLRYRAIILGFIHEMGVSRWLTDDEISVGVLDAIRLDDGVRIVGTVQPWSARPRSDRA